MKRNDRLVVFDVEGVLLPKRRLLLFEIAPRLGFLAFLRFLTIGILYEIGLLRIESALKRLYQLMKGMTIDELFRRFRRLPLAPDVTKLFSKVKKLGFKTALISSGLPRLLVEDLAGKIGADYASGLEIGLDDGILTGEIWGEVIKSEGKTAALRDILGKTKISPRDCIVVADDRNNLSMLQLCGVSIGFNPDFILSFNSDFAVTGSLLGILPVLDGGNPARGGPLSSSMVIRELIHLSGILVPFVCMYLLNVPLVAASILMVTSLYAISEFLRLTGINLPIVSTITTRSADQYELQEFATSPIFYAVGIMLSLLLFRQPVSYASIAILAFGDGFAAIFGRRLGRTVLPLNKAKKVEGSLSGWFFAFLGSLIFIDPLRALIGATVGTLAECLPSPVNDNLVIPLASGLVLTLTL
ncbi:MAG: haloacid dehalogenase-like hydrolase [Candidatus Bathyarchaeia archaeon]